MSNIVAFESAKLPSFLSKAAPALNEDLTAGVGAGFAVLSLKGKNWTVKRGGEANLLTRELDGETIAAPSVEVVILKAAKNFGKTWYATSFVEGSDAKPDCYSNDGLAPAADAEKPQSKTCATCKKNEWGSKISDTGSKGKACQDVRRLAVAPAGQINDPMLLRVPPATLKPLAEYAKMLSKRGAPYNGVITKMKFDPEAATPKIMFEATRFLNEAEYAEVQEVMADPVIEDIIGTTGIPMHVDGDEPAIPGENPAKPKKTVTVEDDEPAPAPAPKKTKAKPAEVSEDDVADVLEEKPAKKAAPVEEEAPAPKKTKVVEVAVDDELDSLLDELDD